MSQLIDPPLDAFADPVFDSSDDAETEPPLEACRSTLSHLPLRSVDEPLEASDVMDAPEISDMNRDAPLDDFVAMSWAVTQLMAKVAPLDALAVISRPSALYFPDTLSEDPDDADSFVIKGDFTTMVTFSAQLPRFFVLRHERVLSETVVSISSITSSGADTVTDEVSHCMYVT